MKLAIALIAASTAHAQVLYEVIDLTAGANDDVTSARAVNNSPRVTGFAVVGDMVEKGLMWKDGQVLFEFLVLPKDNSTAGVGLNDNDVAAGVSEEVFFMGKELYEDQKACIWQGGAVLNVEDLVAFDPDLDPRFARDVNDDNHIVGHARIFGQPPHELRGFLAADGLLTDLGDLTRPEAINNNDLIVGYALGDSDAAHQWSGGKASSLHTGLAGDVSRAFDLNELDVIVGEAMFEAGGALAPAVWINGVPVPVIDAATSGTARGVNLAGDIVGWTDAGGFVRTGASVRPLIDVIAKDQGWDELLAYDINDAGMIVGDGVRNGEAGHAFMLIPICAADFNGDAEQSILDFIAFQEAFVAGHPAADVNADGVLNILDFVTFQLVFVEGCD